MNSPSLSQIGHWEQVQKAIRDISGFGALSSQVLIIVFIVFLSPRWWLSMPSSSSSPLSLTLSSLLHQCHCQHCLNLTLSQPEFQLDFSWHLKQLSEQVTMSSLYSDRIISYYNLHLNLNSEQSHFILMDMVAGGNGGRGWKALKPKAEGALELCI